MLLDAALGLYLICDGMGGHAGGQVASQLAATTIAGVLRTGSPAADGEADALVTAIRLANDAVFSQARADRALHNMGTTVAAARVDLPRLHLCHVGDSRIYRLRRGRLEQLTRDHSLINLYQDNPQLAMRLGAPSSNVIIRAVGLRDQVDIDHRTVLVETGDLFLLCCDGLTDMVDDWILREVLTAGVEGPLEECCDALMRAAMSNGGLDNVTAILLRVDESSAA